MAGTMRFLSYCRMTCVGGSERGECPCTHPAVCELVDDPDYTTAREAAMARMGDYLLRGLEKADKSIHPILAFFTRKSRKRNPSD